MDLITLRVTRIEVWRLYAEHILARDVRQFEGMRSDLYRILQDTADSAGRAGESASAFDRALIRHAGRLERAPPVETVQHTLFDLRTDTGKMRAMTADLVAKLQASTEEVNVLTRKLRQAQSEAQLDALTGLRNRRGFELAAREIEILRGSLEGTAVLMADIDHFKRVNDEHGHILGDKVLRAVAHALSSNIQGRDIAARVGGEEFAVLLPDTSLSGAESLSNKIRSLIARGRITRTAGQGTIGQVTVSIGVAIAQQGESLETLLERADAALYRAKRVGRNRVAVASYPPSLASSNPPT